MKTEQTRALIERFLEARDASDRDTVASMLADDVVWRPPVGSGLGPYEGRDVVLDALVGGAGGTIFKLETMHRTVHKIVVEGGSAVVFLRNQAELVKGGQYDNEYAWHYEFEDDRVVSIQHYADTLNAVKQMGLLKH